jgi:hypothetical protein
MRGPRVAAKLPASIGSAERVTRPVPLPGRASARTLSTRFAFRRASLTRMSLASRLMLMPLFRLVALASAGPAAEDAHAVGAARHRQMPVFARLFARTLRSSQPDHAHWNFCAGRAQSDEPDRVLRTLRGESSIPLLRPRRPMITVPVELIWLAVTFTMVMAGFLAAASE